MTRRDGYVPGSGQGKHPTKATKLEVLGFVARCAGADVLALTQRFWLSDTGARVKLWRLTRQGLLDIDPDSCRHKTWQLTRAGWRHLKYLREAEQYMGGTKGLLVSKLTAEVAQLKAENEHWRNIIEDGPSIFRDVVDLANEKLALVRALNEARADNGRLRAQIAAYQQVLLSRSRGKS